MLPPFSYRHLTALCSEVEPQHREHTSVCARGLLFWEECLDGSGGSITVQTTIGNGSSASGAGLSFWVARTLLSVISNPTFGRLESSFRRMLLLVAKCDNPFSFVKI